MVLLRIFFILKKSLGAVEMGQWLKAPDALPEDSGSVPSTSMAGDNRL